MTPTATRTPATGSPPGQKLAERHGSASLRIGRGVFTGPHLMVEALRLAVAEHTDHVAAARVAAALEAARDDEYERWLPVLNRPSRPKYLDAAVPSHVRDRFEAERAGVA